MALSPEVVDFVGFQIQYQIGQTLAIRQVTVVQKQAITGLMRICVDMVDPSGGERGSTPHQTMHRITFFQQQFSKVRTVLTSDSGNECGF